VVLGAAFVARMKILHIHRIGGIGGSERHLLTLLPALAQLGVEVRFLGLDDPSAAPDTFYAQLPVPYERLPSPRDVDPLLGIRVARSIRHARPDIVHTHLVHADLYGAAHGRKLVSTKHNDDPFRVGPFRFVERALAERAARIIAITDALRRFQIEHVGIPERKVVTIHYGLDAPPVAWGTNPPDDTPADAHVLLAVCRLQRQKGLDVAVHALGEVRERHPQAELVVLGEGPERGRLESLARDASVPVRLLGRVPDVGAWLERSSLLVHPVRWEGFGLAVLEAMLAARPVVASDVSSLPELVVDGETGALVPPEDPGALAAALSHVLDDPGSLGANGRRRARNEFSVQRMVESTLAVYESVLAGSDVSGTHHPPPTQEKGGARA
jgi:glycosyltransferase involved in cell wall biosynthesis